MGHRGHLDGWPHAAGAVSGRGSQPCWFFFNLFFIKLIFIRYILILFLLPPPKKKKPPRSSPCPYPLDAHFSVSASSTTKTTNGVSLGLSTHSRGLSLGMSTHSRAVPMPRSSCLTQNRLVFFRLGVYFCFGLLFGC